MREYGKLATRIWTDPRFLQLSEQAKMVFIYLLAGPETNLIGCFRVTAMHVAASEVCSLPAAEKAFDQLCDSGLIKYDKAAKVVLLPNFIKYNPICNASSGKAALKAIKLIPDSELLAEIIPQIIDIFEDNSWADQLPMGWRHECEHKCRHTCPPPIPSQPIKNPTQPGARETALKVLGYLNQVSGRSFTRPDDIEKCLRREGASFEDCCRVIDFKASQWAGTEMAKHLNATTPFRAAHFGAYLDEAKAGPVDPQKRSQGGLNAFQEALIKEAEND